MIQRNEIYLASFPFGDTAGMKLRQVLTLTSPLGPLTEVFVAYISSVIPNPQLPSDIILDPVIAEHRTTNLKSRSAVRLHKLATVHASVVIRRLGSLSTATISEVDQKLRGRFNRDELLLLSLLLNAILRVGERRKHEIRMATFEKRRLRFSRKSILCAVVLLAILLTMGPALNG